ncbi:hypothetical protein [Halobacillus litoralis]|uniref:Uncharacterized protein n=1 Tax=Halobacillus litoralis TaxID=45668 RepID=A0A410MFW3_9BACI|nr:hypothetical protein [Halobacillus litoralis]QAS53555.1 hypothetical protein HLI_15775 [Halobacillus litoralis]
MQKYELFKKVNKSVEEMDLVTARTYMEENFEALDENKHQLNRNARELLKFFAEKREKGEKPLTRQELSDLNSMNIYSTRFDVRGLKLLIKDKESLLMKKEALGYLNSDAKTLLAGMGAIEKG